METYIIKHVANTCNWDDVPSLEVTYKNWRENPGIKMSAQIAWNEKALFFHSTCVEKNIRAELFGTADQVADDSCMEFFFRPEESDMRYINIETNPNCAQYIGIGTDLEHLTRLIPPNAKELFSVRTELTMDGWELWFTVPIDYLRNFYNRIGFYSGKIIYANVFKTGAKTQVRHSLSWQEMDPSVKTFHNSACFGKMVLE